jgi:hypothetical protein
MIMQIVALNVAVRLTSFYSVIYIIAITMPFLYSNLTVEHTVPRPLLLPLMESPLKHR